MFVVVIVVFVIDWFSMLFCLFSLTFIGAHGPTRRRVAATCSSRTYSLRRVCAHVERHRSNRQYTCYLPVLRAIHAGERCEQTVELKWIGERNGFSSACQFVRSFARSLVRRFDVASIILCVAHF